MEFCWWLFPGVLQGFFLPVYIWLFPWPVFSAVEPLETPWERLTVSKGSTTEKTGTHPWFPYPG